MTEPSAEIITARQLRQQQKLADALAIYQSVVAATDASSDSKCEAFHFIAGWHQTEGRLDEAIDNYNLSIEENSRIDFVHFDLGLCQEKKGETQKALKSYLDALDVYPRNARYYLYAGAMLNALDREDEALSVWSLGADIDPVLQHAHRMPNVDEDLRQKSLAADQALREHFTTLHSRSVSEVEELRRVRDAIWPQTHNSNFAYKEPQQKPSFFYIPDLPATPVFDRLSWMEVIEAEWQAIRDEYLTACKDIEGTPYIHGNMAQGAEWDALRDNQNWHSIHLYRDAQIQDGVAGKFPVTLAALERMPVVKVNGVTLEAFFSVLAPGTHIPPHYGLANSRLTVHLPLIVPDGCALRVADQTCLQEEGKILAFDDSFEHEAWNKSDQTRVVLIFEAWAPDLSEEEQRAIEASFDARTNWLNAREIPQV